MLNSTPEGTFGDAFRKAFEGGVSAKDFCLPTGICPYDKSQRILTVINSEKFPPDGSLRGKLVKFEQKDVPPDLTPDIQERINRTLSAINSQQDIK